MPGGVIKIEIGGDFSIRMTGLVTKVAEGVMDPEMLGVMVTTRFGLNSS